MIGRESYIPKSEGQLLQDLLDMLTPDGAFRLGEIMGIMRKGDAVQISRLEREIADLRETIEVLRDARESYEQDGKS